MHDCISMKSRWREKGSPMWIVFVSQDRSTNHIHSEDVCRKQVPLLHSGSSFGLFCSPTEAK